MWTGLFILISISVQEDKMMNGEAETKDFTGQIVIVEVFY